MERKWIGGGDNGGGEEGGKAFALPFSLRRRFNSKTLWITSSVPDCRFLVLRGLIPVPFVPST